MPDDFEDDDETAAAEPPATEGVRILGAEEAQAAVESGSTGARRDEPPRPRREPPPDARPAARFPLPTDRPSDIEAPTPRPTPPPAPTSESSGPLPLPHWTEPPTGEVPMISAEEDEDIFSGSTPRFRADAGDWSESDFGDFDEEPVHDDSGAFGALVDVPEVDEDEAFAAEVAAKRAPTRRPRGRAARAGAAAGATAYGATEAGPSPARFSTSDDFRTRAITAGVLVVIGLIAFLLGRAATATLVTVIVAVAAFELYEGVRRAGFQPATVIGLLGSAALVGIAYNYGERAFPLVSAVVVGFTLFWYLAKVVHARPMVNAAVTLLGFTYVGILGGFAGLLLVYPDGVGMVIGLVLCAVAYDVVGYLVGSRIGRRPLAPDISPNKTIEGLAAGMGAAVLTGAIVAVILDLTPWNSLGDGLLLGIVVAIFAPLGDLCESMLKRDLGLKDLGTLLPGHGGVLDRFDAMLFCLPAVYYLVLARGLI
ncbi:MAG TPA: phosphatidate cytidylyltransferase [Acidimicrobiia bacterium]